MPESARVRPGSRSSTDSDQARSKRPSAKKGRVHDFAAYRPKKDGAAASAGDTGYGDLIEAAQRTPTSATGELIDSVFGLPRNTDAKSESQSPPNVGRVERARKKLQKQKSEDTGESANTPPPRISKTDASTSQQGKTGKTESKGASTETTQVTRGELVDGTLKSGQESEFAETTEEEEQTEDKQSGGQRRAELGESLGLADTAAAQEISPNAKVSRTPAALAPLDGGGAQAVAPLSKAPAPPVAEGPAQLAVPALPEPTIEASDPAAEAESMEAELEEANEDAYEPVEPPEPEIPEPRALDLPESATSIDSDAEPTASDFSRLGLKPPPNDTGDEVVVADTGGAPGQLSPVELDIAQQQLAAEAAPTEYSGGPASVGTPIAEPPTPQKPELSALSPEAALSAAGSLDPGVMRGALGGVAAAVGRSVGEKRADLAANPPKLPRPSGSPAVGKAARRPKPKSAPTAKKVGKVPGGAARPTPRPTPLPAPPPPVTAKVPTPTIVTTNEGGVSPSDAQRVSKALRDLPSSDADLYATAGPPPAVELQGNADPELTERQHVELGNTVAETQRRGTEDISQDMGERSIAPVVPDEILTASLPASEPAPQSQAAAGAGQTIDPTLSLIAKEKRSAEIDAAVSDASAKMTAKRRDHATRVREEKRQSAADISALEATNAAEQTSARTAAQVAVADAREKWSRDQETLIAEKRTEAAQAVEQAQGEINDTTRKANDEAAEKIEAGNDEAERVRKQAERDADKKKEESEKESGGFLGWLASKAKALFEKIKAAVTAIFEFARTVIRKAIELAKKLAVEVIERARQAIVSLIESVGKVLIAIGDVLLAAFPKLREKWRGFIEEQVERATAAVNELAEQLKTGVVEFLDALGSALDKALGLLEKGLNAIIDRVASAVDSAIKFAESVAQALGAFTTLIGHIAGNPLGWIKNLGAGVVDGIKNHLWTALKSGIKEWFNAKLEQVIGLGSTVWTLLKEGGFSFEAVGKMVWDTLKTMIPQMLVKLLIEKLVSMIVPAAGAIMAIIEGLQAAWGAIQRIIAAFQAFFAFLKQVRDGNAGPKFATALAAAAVAVLDFVSNWLIAKLVKGAKKIGGKLKGIAKRIAKKRKAKRKKRKDARGPKKVTKNEKELRAKRLRKAVTAIQPKAEVLLKKGVLTVRLRAQLALWRVRYRIRTLTLEPQGNRFRFLAANSPPMRFGGGFKAQPAEVFEIVREIARERFAAAQKKAVTNKLGEDLHNKNVTLPSKEDPTQLGAALAAQDVENVKKGHISISTGAASGKEVSAKYPQDAKTKKGVTNLFINGLGTYPEITEKLAEKGLTGSSLTDEMYKAIHGKPADIDAKRMVTLMFGTEVARSEMTALTAPLTIQGLSEGTITNKKAFGKKGDERPEGGGLFPPSQSGTTQDIRDSGVKEKLGNGFSNASERTEKRFSDGISKPKETKIDRSSEENIKRTAGLVQQVTKNMKFKTRPGLKRAIRSLLKKFDTKVIG